MNNPFAFDDVDEVPSSGTELTLLVWLERHEFPNSSQPQYLISILDAPDEWSRDLELYDPRWTDVPKTVRSGVFILRVVLEYDLDADGDVDRAVCKVQDYMRVVTPTPHDLQNFDWGDGGVEA